MEQYIYIHPLCVFYYLSCLHCDIISSLYKFFYKICSYHLFYLFVCLLIFNFIFPPLFSFIKDGDNNACQENEQNNNDIDNKRDNDYTSIEVNNVCIDENHKIGENEISKYSNKTYKLGNIIGNGSFGVVYEATCIDTSEKVAIKKVLQDPQYKNRELMIMKNLNHLNIIYLKDYYYTEAIKKNEKNVFLNVVMEYIPQTVHKYMKYYLRNNQFLPIFLVKLYSYQLCRALGYLHSKLICHRDLKPQNLLIDPKTHTLKLCDFGSAKSLISGQRSVSYICSRFYRAPELMLGSTNYTTHIDLWSLGIRKKCVYIYINYIRLLFIYSYIIYSYSYYLCIICFLFLKAV